MKIFPETAELIGINGEIGTVMEEYIPGNNISFYAQFFQT